MGFEIVFTFLIVISTVHMMPEKPKLEEPVSSNLLALESVINSHHGVFSQMVVKPLLSQLEKRPGLLDQMRENELGIKVKHESESDTVIDPQSLGLESFHGLRIKVKHNAKSEFEVEPFVSDMTPVDLMNVEITRKTDTNTKPEKGPMSTQFSKPLELIVIDKQNEPKLSAGVFPTNRVFVTSNTNTPSLLYGGQDASNVRDNVKIGLIQPTNAQDLQDHCYEVFGIIKCNGIPIQQIREFSGRQLIGSSYHRHWQPMRFSLTTNNPEVVRVQKNRLIDRPFILRPGFSYFPRMFFKRQPYFVV